MFLKNRGVNVQKCDENIELFQEKYVNKNFRNVEDFIQKMVIL